MSEKYRPSNSTEGDSFMAKFCDQCANHRGSGSDDHCDILWRTMIESENSPDYPSEWTYRNGQPACTAFAPKTEEAMVAAVRDDRTIEMFQDQEDRRV